MDDDFVSPYVYNVIRATTDKLQEALNDVDPSWEIMQITHVGGRDWVVIVRLPDLNYRDDRDERDDNSD